MSGPDPRVVLAVTLCAFLASKPRRGGPAGRARPERRGRPAPSTPTGPLASGCRSCQHGRSRSVCPVRRCGKPEMAAFCIPVREIRAATATRTVLPQLAGPLRQPLGQSCPRASLMYGILRQAQWHACAFAKGSRGIVGSQEIRRCAKRRACAIGAKQRAKTKKTRRFCLRVKSPAADRRDRPGRRKAYLATFEKALSYGLYASLARSLYISPILVTSPTKPS